MKLWGVFLYHSHLLRQSVIVTPDAAVVGISELQGLDTGNLAGFRDLVESEQVLHGEDMKPGETPFWKLPSTDVIVGNVQSD